MFNVSDIVPSGIGAPPARLRANPSIWAERARHLVETGRVGVWAWWPAGKASTSGATIQRSASRQAPEGHTIEVATRTVDGARRLYMRVTPTADAAPPISCAYCDSVFGSEESHRIHLGRMHATRITPTPAELGHACDLCGDRFATEQGLDVHTGHKHPLCVCPIAGCKFTTRIPGELADHRSVHNGSPAEPSPPPKPKPAPKPEPLAASALFSCRYGCRRQFATAIARSKHHVEAHDDDPEPEDGGE